MNKVRLPIEPRFMAAVGCCIFEDAKGMGVEIVPPIVFVQGATYGR
ncbi:hypothetical protein [Treponema phagedenis]|uniref:Uncharacterized protein n=1 Tax=Treponema phagedenis TaxID=162 RepID=A0A0B7GR28_TREPH|nr:hypothetical protein [Treponema phagedenis]NVP24731.1 hypothetical protein [Treponema phagedenis]QKS93040.1 hypothetical protein HPJ96_11140 [Treponema phagedenis]QLC58920.1 hypothetical protein HW453_09005 [Treponema phagedenis]CEM61029.1 conserved hypothetical protein [Treponema phagedenis]